LCTGCQKLEKYTFLVRNWPRLDLGGVLGEKALGREHFSSEISVKALSPCYPITSREMLVAYLPKNLML
jgi:hypothetical protein